MSVKLRRTIRVAMAAMAVLALADALAGTPGSSADRAAASNSAVMLLLTTAVSPTATGTPTVTLTPASTATATATSTPRVTLTPTLTPTPIATLPAQVYLPYIRRMTLPTPTPTPTTTPTPTATPTPTPIQFAGQTNQNRDVTMLVTGDFSTVTQLRIPVTVVCDGQRFQDMGQIPLPGGLPIINRRFTIRLVAGWSDPDTPVYDEYTGEFDPDFSMVQGTWRKWAVSGEPICDNAGTWHASRQP